MNRIATPLCHLFTATLLAFLLSACGGGGGGLSLSITDAPVHDPDIAEVWVRFTEVIVQPASGSGAISYTVQDDTDPNNILPYRDIELKSLVSGKTICCWARSRWTPATTAGSVSS